MYGSLHQGDGDGIGRGTLERNATHSQSTRHGPAAEVGSSGAPGAAVRLGHAVVVALADKQRVLHFLPGSVVVGERPAAARSGGTTGTTGQV